MRKQANCNYPLKSIMKSKLYFIPVLRAVIHFGDKLWTSYLKSYTADLHKYNSGMFDIQYIVRAEDTLICDQ